MNVRLKKTLGWYCGIVHQDQFSANHCSTELSMITVAPSNEEQNIAYERMKFFIHHVLEDSILICERNPKLEAYQNTGARIITFPEEPIDQVVGMLLYLKLNAIMENRMVITDVEFWSKSGDSVSYLHSVGESLGPLSHDGWWSDTRPCWSLPLDRSTSDKIVSLGRVPEWADYDLDWQDNPHTDQHSVVFAKFGANEQE